MHPVKKVLVIDDETLILKTTCVLLRFLGYQTLEATQGRQGVTVAGSENPDLILLDLIMPGEDGWDILDQLKSDARTSRIPVVIFTARQYANPKLFTEMRGAAGYINKPFQPEELEKIIQGVFAKNAGPI